jgi:hemoglobin
MDIKKDIETRADIEMLVNSFYEKIKADKLLGHIFNDIAHVNWSTHLPAMYDFWENIILFTGSYEGNPLQLHKHLHGISALKSSHFTRWNQLFITTVDALFAGTKAEIAKTRALSISSVLKNKILKTQDKGGEIY